jgi:hypothetical protein
MGISPERVIVSFALMVALAIFTSYLFSQQCSLTEEEAIQVAQELCHAVNISCDKPISVVRRLGRGARNYVAVSFSNFRADISCESKRIMDIQNTIALLSDAHDPREASAPDLQEITLDMERYLNAMGLLNCAQWAESRCAAGKCLTNYNILDTGGTVVGYVTFGDLWKNNHISHVHVSSDVGCEMKE